ncbi:MAG: tail fiber domain-containing protein [Thermoflexales bacterium]|nr:tail fiber domain-containing protein [Thermoflexales bacterium]
MNTPRKAPLAFFVACVVFAFAIAATRAVLAQPPLPPAGGDPAAPAGQPAGSAFTYQGQLRKNGAPVNATCNASFALFDAVTGGNQVGSTVTSSTLQVANGLFTLPLDFGWNLNGEARWLETAIGCGEAQSTLTPRTALRPAPYALALPGLRTVPGNPDLDGFPTMNLMGGVFSGTISNTISASSYNSAIGGGQSNRIDNDSYNSVIGGGWLNRIDNDSIRSVIGGGYSNRIDNSSTASAIGGGQSNLIDNASNKSAIGGGQSNRIDNGSEFGVIGGGGFNVITSAVRAVIPGGYLNDVEGDYGYAAGRRAQALHDGAFVWGDSTNAIIASSAPNQFIVRASGGVTMYTNSAATVGARLLPGSGSWTSVSDRALKANIAAVDPRAVLEAVAALPVSTWNYTAQDPAIRHIGPMAQDFYAAFNVGETDTGISTVDAQGVALAAIQGLRAENTELKARLDRLERNQAAGPTTPVALLLGALGLGLAGMLLAWRRQTQPRTPARGG